MVCVLGVVQRQYTHHMLPQHCVTYNDVSILIISTKV